MSKLVIDDSLVARVSDSLHNRNEMSATGVFASEEDGAAAELAKAEEKAWNYLERNQPSLEAFLLGFTSKLDDKSRAVMLFLSEAIFETFRSAGWTPRQINANELIVALMVNRDIVRQTEPAESRFVMRYLQESGFFRQLALVRYIIGVLSYGHKTCPYKVSNDDHLMLLFMVLKSIIDVLDHDSEIGVGTN